MGYVLASSATSLRQAETVLMQSSKILIEQNKGVNSSQLARLIGATMDMYRYRHSDGSFFSVDIQKGIGSLSLELHLKGTS